MALTVQPLGLAGTDKLIKETSVTATVDNNVADGSTTVYSVRLENDTAGGAKAYFKAWNKGGPSSAVTVGTDAPDMILPVPFTSGASGVLSGRTWTFKTGNSFFASAFSFAAVTTAGTAGVTPPTQAVQAVVKVG